MAHDTWPMAYVLWLKGPAPPPDAPPPAVLWGPRRASSPSLSPSIVSRLAPWRGPWPGVPPRCRPGVHGSAPPAAYGPWPTSSGVWAMATGTRTSPSRSIVRRFCSLAGTMASGATRGPTAPPPRMHPPRRCSGVVVGRLLRPFRPAAQHCKPIFSLRGDASPSVLGTRPPSAAHLFCALCIEIAALCIEIGALCIAMVMLLPSA